jgi:hypothetical protein
MLLNMCQRADLDGTHVKASCACVAQGRYATRSCISMLSCFLLVLLRVVLSRAAAGPQRSRTRGHAAAGQGSVGRQQQQGHSSSSTGSSGSGAGSVAIQIWGSAALLDGVC